MASTDTAPAMDPEPPILQRAPPLDPAWLAYEREANLPATKIVLDPLVRQPAYAAECRALSRAMTAPGARDHRLSRGLVTKYVSVRSSRDGFSIPVLQYDRAPAPEEPGCVIVYYHGGGLCVGEADSEDLSCRRLVRDSEAFLPSVRVYSVGYRLKPQHPASTCVSDSIEAFTHLTGLHPQARVVVAGSSSGGELAAFASQHARAAQIPIHGVLLRCPVTSDAFRGRAYVPAHLHQMHTSAHHPSFQTSILAKLVMDGPRDGLERMPLEVDCAELSGMPQTWVQMCTNDGLYSDGACYAKLLRDAGVEVRTDVVWGWPHTFWLKAPHLDRALEADEAMMNGLRWAAVIDE